MSESRYAAKTQVTADKSRTEIERTLTRYGASAFSYGWEQGRAAIAFVKDGRQVRFVIPMPDREDRQFTHHTRGRRTPAMAQAEYDQAVRQRWRAMALTVKAKLEAVAAGIVTFETEFLPYTVLPSGRTVAQDITPALELAYETGQVTPLQIGGPDR